MVKKIDSQRLTSLDGLKALSIIAVILYYFCEHLLPGGYLAVNVFLLISGFLNFRHFVLADKNGFSVNTKEYYKRRFTRLFFPMLFVVALTVVVVLVAARKYFYNLRNMGFSSLLFVNNIYQTISKQSYFTRASNPSPFTHLWYVSLYGQLVLLTPLLVKLFYSWNKKPLVLANFLIVTSLVSAFLMGYLYQPGQDPSFIYYGLLTRLFPYTLGGAIGVVLPSELNWKKLKRKRSIAMDLVTTICFLIMFMMLKFMYGTQAFAYRIGMLLFTILAALILIMSLHPQTIWNKLLSFKGLGFIGKRVYSYYLVFYPIYLVTRELLTFLNEKAILNYSLQILLVVLVGGVVYQLFERKCISLPIGQDFNKQKTIHQFNYLKNNPGKLKNVRIATVLYCLLVASSFLAIFFAPESRANKAKELQERIKQNKALVDESINNETENNKIINNIEGLSQQEMLYANGLEITFIGDSTVLTAAQELSEVFPKAVNDSSVGRQLYNSVPVVNSLKENNKLNSLVITGLGSNGAFTKDQIDDYIKAVGDERDLFFITSPTQRPWVGEANKQIIQAAQRNGNVKIIDWANYSKDHPNWFEDDAGHLSVEGAHEFAVYIAKELYRQR